MEFLYYHYHIYIYHTLLYIYTYIIHINTEIDTDRDTDVDIDRYMIFITGAKTHLSSPLGADRSAGSSKLTSWTSSLDRKLIH